MKKITENDMENTNIMQKVREIEKNIENIQFKHLGEGQHSHILIQPDFKVIIGGTEGNERETAGLKDRFRQYCECFYGGEKMHCVSINENAKQKPVCDAYFPRNAREGKETDQDIYTNCPVRKLAEIINKAYLQGKDEEK